MAIPFLMPILGVAARYAAKQYRANQAAKDACRICGRPGDAYIRCCDSRTCASCRQKCLTPVSGGVRFQCKLCPARFIIED